MNAIGKAVLVLAFGLAWTGTSSPADAGWGVHWGHHNHWGSGPYWRWGGAYTGWGWPAHRSYTSVYLSVPRYHYRYVHTTHYIPSCGFNFYVPTVRHYYPPVYYAPTYCLPTTYVAPLVYPTYVVDPCAYSLSMQDGIGPGLQTVPVTYLSKAQQASPSKVPSGVGGTQTSFVDRMLAVRNGTGSQSTSTLGKSATVNRRTSPNASLVSVVTGGGSNPSATTAPVPKTGGLMAPVPVLELEAADQVFASGTYLEAAGAYARLAVRYGNHDALTVRRFIALVASGDHSQAAVVAELAQINGQALTRDTLPGGNLSQLYGQAIPNKQAHIDSLASFALKSTGDSVALSMVGTWLQLDGQPERAELFERRVAQMKASSAAAENEVGTSTVLAKLSP